MRLRILLLLLFGSTLALAYQIGSGALQISDHWNPWAPLVIAETPNFWTRYKLDRLARDSALCRSVLTQARMRYTPLPDGETGPGCGFTNAVRVEATSASIGEPFALSCRSAVALAMWEHHVLQPAADARFGQRISVQTHWPDKDGDAQFLRDIHRGACRYFDTVLGPDYNDAHRDQLHFDRGSFRMCQ